MFRTPTPPARPEGPDVGNAAAVSAPAAAQGPVSLDEGLSAAPKDPIRTRIIAMAQRLSLPTVTRALGILEGEHPSGRRGSGYEFLDERFYQAGDEARLIDWKASARRGRPVIADKERTVTSKVWMLLDGGVEMTGLTRAGENKYRVAFNAMRMFAMLSLRRGDDITILAANRDDVFRATVNRDFAQFDQTLRSMSNRLAKSPRSMKQLLRCAKRIPDRRSLIVIVSDETGWQHASMSQIKALRRTHQIVAVSIDSLNPFSVPQTPHGAFDAHTDRRIPAYLRTRATADELTAHRAFLSERARTELTRHGVTYLSGESSEDIFRQFVTYLSTIMKNTDISRGVTR